MKLDLRFYAAAAGLVLMAAPLCAQAQTADDDLLRPMIVRPADSPSSSASSAPMAPSPSSSTMVTPSAISSTSSSDATAALNTNSSGASTTRLQVPSLPPANNVNLGSGAVAAPVSSKDIFSNFGPPSGSAVSDRVFQLRDEALALRQSVNKNSAEYDDSKGKGASGAIQYHSTVAAITARLEAGTTRGNPILVRQWSEAEQSLSEVNYSISRLNMLATSLAGNSAAAAYLLQAVRAAFELSGALDEDHDQLAMIRDEASKTAVEVDRMRDNVSEDINRQNSYLANERRNLQALAVAINRGELMRNSLASQSVVVAPTPSYGTLPNTVGGRNGYPTIDAEPTALMPPPEAAPVEPVSRSSITKSGKKVSSAAPKVTKIRAAQAASNDDTATLGQLLVLVRFNQDNIDYEQPMYQAVSTALDRNPDANFTVVAVTPKSGDNIGSNTESAQRHADEVKNSLVQLGLQPSRISMSSVSSEAAEGPEVHVYIR